MPVQSAPQRLDRPACSQLEGTVAIEQMTEQEAPAAVIAPMYQNQLKLLVNGKPAMGLVDTGAAISCVSQNLLNQIGINQVTGSAAIPYIVGVSGERQKTLGTVDLELTINRLRVMQRFHVFNHLHCSLILGMDFLNEKRASINIHTKTLSIMEGTTEQLLEPVTGDVLQARTVAHVTIPPQSECRFPVKIKGCPNQAILLEPASHLPTALNIMGARCLNHVTGEMATYRIMNPTNSEINICPGKIIATAQCVDFIEENAADTTCVNYAQDTSAVSGPHVNSEDSNMTAGCHDNSSHGQDVGFIKVAKQMGFTLDNSTLTEVEKEKCMAFLGKNRDIFAMDLSELGCTNIYKHRIETGDAPPQRQRFYRTSASQREAIEKQVKEMLDNGIIEPSSSSWLSPPVLVKKSSGGATLCSGLSASQLCY